MLRLIFAFPVTRGDPEEVVLAAWDGAAHQTNTRRQPRKRQLKRRAVAFCQLKTCGEDARARWKFCRHAVTFERRQQMASQMFHPKKERN